MVNRVAATGNEQLPKVAVPDTNSDSRPDTPPGSVALTLALIPAASMVHWFVVPPNVTAPVTIQSPDVTTMLVTFALTLLVSVTADPELIAETIASPTMPAAALS